MSYVKKFNKYFENKSISSDEVDEIVDFLEKNTNYSVHIYTEDEGEVKGFELETYTDGGVNMIIFLDLRGKEINIENVIEEFESYIDDFDIEDQINMHRQAEDYKNAFTMRESLDDFEKFKETLKEKLGEMKSNFDISSIKENYEIHYSDGIRAMKRSSNLKNAIEKANELKNREGMQFVNIFKADSGFHSTADEKRLVKWWGRNSYWANTAKEKPELLDKQLESNTIDDNLHPNHIEAKEKYGYDFEDQNTKYSVKKLNKNECDLVKEFPNFHKSGSIIGMKKKYGTNALLVRCGDYIYNVTSEPKIYFEEAE